MKLIKKLVSLTETNVRMLQELMATGQFSSEAEVIRHALRLAHKKEFPYYKKVAEAKDEEWKAKEELKKLPLEQFVAKVLQGDLSAKPGFCRLVHKDNPARVADVPINLVKNYFSRNEVWDSLGIPPESSD